MIYVVIAYKWGWINNTHFLVCATSNYEKAIKEAKITHKTWEGKCGVVVYDTPDILDDDTYVVFYLPSSYNENRPFVNKQLELYKEVGAKVVLEIERNKNNDIPTWIKDIIEHKKQVLNLVTNIKENNKCI
jgi:hypothetical protein